MEEKWRVLDRKLKTRTFTTSFYVMFPIPYSGSGRGMDRQYLSVCLRKWEIKG